MHVELIYDLIFVYVIGRNNALLHHVENGFVEAGVFFTYVMCTLAVIQIWNFTTYYINAFGRNGARDHVFMFINMFLLYFIAEGTRFEWQEFHTQYHIAWSLILLNIAVQYLLELRNQRGDTVQLRRISRIAVILLIESSLTALAIAEFSLFNHTLISVAAVLFGICAPFFANKKSCATVVDFEHLSERAMLYVVFTFGEMVIAIAGYFEGDFNLNSLYFALMGFLIVVGLFLSYGVVYDHIVDREKQTSGLGYMLVHVLIIFSLNNITSALEFMRRDDVDLLPKIIFITLSVISYFVFLFIISRYAKEKCCLNKRFYLLMLAVGAVFAALMLLFREQMKINIAVTVAYVFAVFLILHYNGARIDKKPGDDNNTK